MILLPLLVAGVRFEHVARAASGQDELRDAAQLDAVDLEKLLPTSLHREGDKQYECRGQDSVAWWHLVTPDSPSQRHAAVKSVRFCDHSATLRSWLDAAIGDRCLVLAFSKDPVRCSVVP